MAGGNYEIRERLSSLKALLSAVLGGEDVRNMVVKILNLESNMEQIQESLMEKAQIRKNNEDMCYKVIVLRIVMTYGEEMGPHCLVVRVPEPKSFGATRSAKELENFLLDIEQYYVIAKVPKTEKVTIASMYLIDNAKLWRRTCMVDDANAGRQKIDTWDRFKKEMKDQFLSSNTQNVKDLPSALIAADALVDLRISKDNLNTFSSFKSNFIRKDKKGECNKDGKKEGKKKDL
ncbi:hypothetical protein ZIOFF_042383 [Zingiber officinale]|uniref:Uncharacterized protein n=1 Tax=Zingiber officinale TaxID=94328 RepID=A0A8J5G1M5_ZINOF|nr:hypothetical protein ZIOFF_042383 [Zingiber officinale]